MLQKLIVALISAILFCLFLTILHVLQYPASERQPNTYYFSFSELMVIYLTYATPVFVFGGIPCSIIIDKINRIKTFPSMTTVYFFNIGLYGLAGILSSMIFFAILYKGKIVNLDLSTTFWAIPALLFYHVSIAHRSFVKFFNSSVNNDVL